MKKSSTLSSALLLLGAFVVGAIAVNQLLSFARTAEGTHRGGDDPVIVTEQKSDDSAKSDDKATSSDTKKDEKSDARKDGKGSGKDSTSSKSTKTRTDGKGSGGEENEGSTSQTGDGTGAGTTTEGGAGTGRGSSGDESGSGEGNGSSTGGSSDTGGGNGDTGGNGTSSQTVAYPSSSSVYGTGTPQSLSRASERQQRVVREAKSTKPTQAGYSASWVETVFHNAGIGSFSGNSCDLYELYCDTSDLSELKVGMIVAVSSHSRSTSGSKWGHVGIYVGDGQVMDCSDGRVRTLALSEWIDYYGTNVPVKWGWIGGVNLA